MKEQLITVNNMTNLYMMSKVKLKIFIKSILIQTDNKWIGLGHRVWVLNIGDTAEVDL